MGRHKKYFTEEERKAANNETKKYWKKIHPEKYRAMTLLSNYKASDKKCNRGECSLTVDWIMKHIFTKPCVHCGRTGWDIIGCNRLDNSQPHTPDNVEPCCGRCNNRLGTEELRKEVFQIDPKTNEIIRIWDSAQTAEKYGFNSSHIRSCCRGERKTHGGFIWSSKPLN